MVRGVISCCFLCSDLGFSRGSGHAFCYLTLSYLYVALGYCWFATHSKTGRASRSWTSDVAQMVRRRYRRARQPFCKGRRTNGLSGGIVMRLHCRVGRALLFMGSHWTRKVNKAGICGGFIARTTSNTAITSG